MATAAMKQGNVRAALRPFDKAQEAQAQDLANTHRQAAPLAGKPVAALFPKSISELLIKAGYPTTEALRGAAGETLAGETGLSLAQARKIIETINLQL
jgi:hypothetical protein